MNALGVGAFQILGVAIFEGSSQCVALGVLAVSSHRVGVLPLSLLPHAGVQFPDNVQAGVLEKEEPQAGVLDPDLLFHAEVIEPDPVHIGV